jgi:hypothetical protein
MAKKDKYAGLNRIIKIVNKLNSGIASCCSNYASLTSLTEDKSVL